MIKYATAGTQEKILEIIADFYCSKVDTITLDTDGTVYHNGRRLSTRVKKIKNRFVFGK